VAHNPKVSVVGDLNDTPESTPPAPLIQQTDLGDVMRPLYLQRGRPSARHLRLGR